MQEGPTVGARPVPDWIPSKIPIEGEVEVEPGLFTVGDDIGPRLELVVDGRNDRVVYHFGDVVAAEPVQVGAGELKPGGEGIAADDGSAKRDGLHREFGLFRLYREPRQVLGGGRGLLGS